MTCNHCGTTLPAGAIFCGECGRRVAAVEYIAPLEAASPAKPDSELIPPPPPGVMTGGWTLSEELESSLGLAEGLTQEPERAADAAADAPAPGMVSPAPVQPNGDPADSAGAPSGSAAENALNEVARNPLTCAQCGAQLGPGDIFCGECGSVSASVTAAFTGAVATRRGESELPPIVTPRTPEPQEATPPMETSPRVKRPVEAPPSEDKQSAEATPPLEPGEPAASRAGAAASAGPVQPLPTMPVFVQSPPGALPTPIGGALPGPSGPPVIATTAAPAKAAPAAPTAPPVRSVDAVPVDAVPVDAVPVDAVPVDAVPANPIPVAPVAPPVATPVPAPTPRSVASEDQDDVEATRIVQRRGGERYVLQFSTGESVTVYGTGLVGRNPRPEPGEYFEQLVRVLDTGRSVSKTHLEFGQENGVFWIKDRFSGNGTVLKEPDAAPRRCEADKRYHVVRGSRVEIGEQFFVVS